MKRWRLRDDAFGGANPSLLRPSFEGMNLTGYRIEVSTDGTSWSDLVADTGNTDTFYRHTGLSRGSTRHYHVTHLRF